MTNAQPNIFANELYQNFSNVPQLIDNGYPSNIPLKDYIHELDTKLKTLDSDFIKTLSENDEYLSLANEIQGVIQEEIVGLLKHRLNSNPTIIANVKRQLQIINELQTTTKENERKSLLELNDYIKNYSHLTFDEYKNIKNGVSQAVITNQQEYYED